MTNTLTSPRSKTSIPTLDPGLQRLSVKYYLDRPEGFEPESLIPVFHGWIQQKKLEGLLIDVADYTHVHHGPGLMIVAHEGHYRLEDTDGRLGMEWAAKRGLDAPLGDRITDAFRKTLLACLVLESERGLEREFRFPTDEFLFRTQDRLRAPDAEKTLSAVRPHLEAVLNELYPNLGYRMERESSPDEGFALRVHLDGSPDLARLIQRAGG